MKQAVEKKDRVQKIMNEVEEANKRAIDVKEGKKKEEKDLEMKIVEYNRQKALREEEHLAEQRRQSEIDALRAKRAFEESERIA